MTEPTKQPQPEDPPRAPDNQNGASPVVRGAGHVDQKELARFVTTIKNAEQQVGEHIIRALQHDNTVAVVTTVVMGADGQQKVVSAALNPERMQQVEDLLQEASDERQDEEPCIGFHCLIKPKDEEAPEDENSKS